MLIEACKKYSEINLSNKSRDEMKENSLENISSDKHSLTPVRSEKATLDDAERSKEAYIGRFRNIQMIKDSIYRYACGSLYKGQRKLGKREGFGQFTLATGDASYEGNWLNGLQHGKGTLRFLINQFTDNAEQGSFTGEWEHGLKNGT